jgi:hypothetical protein
MKEASMSEEPFPDPFSDPAAYEAESLRVRRKLATEYLKLYIVCEEPRCRRARRCTVDEAPCVLRYKWFYQHLMPPLYKDLQAKLAAQEAEEGKTPHG